MDSKNPPHLKNQKSLQDTASALSSGPPKKPVHQNVQDIQQQLFEQMDKNKELQKVVMRCMNVIERLHKEKKDSSLDPRKDLPPPPPKNMKKKRFSLFSRKKDVSASEKQGASEEGKETPPSKEQDTAPSEQNQGQEETAKNNDAAVAGAPPPTPPKGMPEEQQEEALPGKPLEADKNLLETSHKRVTVFGELIVSQIQELQKQFQNQKSDIVKMVEEMKRNMEQHQKTMKALEEKVEDTRSRTKKLIGLYEVVTNQFNPFVEKDEKGIQQAPPPMKEEKEPTEETPTPKQPLQNEEAAPAATSPPPTPTNSPPPVAEEKEEKKEEPAPAEPPKEETKQPEEEKTPPKEAQKDEMADASRVMDRIRLEDKILKTPPSSNTVAFHHTDEELGADGFPKFHLDIDSLRKG